uniref:Hemicentin-1 n=1 Tax=Sus scrofa TaxID=9823 RepID=A0A8D0P964_PIG
MKVQVGQRVDLPCSAQGTPLPVITWFKGGSAVLTDGLQHISHPDGTLGIKQVTLSDAGVYTCVATNIAGSDETEITLHVQGDWGPRNIYGWWRWGVGGKPRMESVQNNKRVPIIIMTNFISPQDGQYLTVVFNFVVKYHKALISYLGTPKPAIKWLRNGRELTGGEPGISILESGTLLVIASVTPYDNGEYICVAANEAGTTERKYNLKVHVPPVIKDQEQVTNVSVLVNQLTSLVCEAEGAPSPIIMWYKDDIQVNGDIPSLSAPEDAGRYSCKAINIAGTSQKYFNISVLVPPTIIGAGSPSEVSAVLNQDIALECQVKGTPFPVIHWFKDGKPLFLGDPTIELLDNGQVLHLRNVRRSDKGRYQCAVSNAAGKQAKDVKLTVYIPPSIKGGNVTTEISALINSIIKLECETRGLPVPAITWYKDDQPVISSSQALYIDKRQILHIPRAQVSDSATYKCQVTNVAGTAEKSFHVDVYVPPMIEGDMALPINKQVVMAHSLTLECKAAGNPPPVLTWLKDGVPMKASDNIHIEAGGKTLEITSALEVDRGQYTCVATSVAGEKEIKYEVDVLAIEGGDETSYFIVMVNNLLELDCQVAGSPPPTIMWLKDGQVIDEREGFKILLNGRKLIIAQAQVSDTGLYRCVATNPAGDHKKEFEVTSSGRVLHIAKALMEDAGKYTCAATNAAGETQQHVQLHVVCVELLKKFFNEMGFSSPLLAGIMWYKDNRPLSGSGSVTFLNRGQIISIESAQITDAGIYKCVAINSAGATELFYSLQVHVPPSISGGSNMVAVVVNNMVRLECEARGIPAPSLTWLKDGSPVASFANGIQVLSVLSGGRILALTSAQISDTGRYTCVAVNAAGEKQRDIDLRVYVAPNIMGEEQNVSVLISQAVELLCQSDAIPLPTLTWLKDGRPLLKKPGISVAENGNAQVQDSGRYTCEATNVAGKTEKNYNVNIWANSGSHPTEIIITRGKSISLECEVQGIPQPTVTWMKDGRPLTKERGMEITDEGRILQLKNVHVSDTGRYVCVAMNIAGMTDRKYDLSVHTPPSIIGSHRTPENISVVEKNSVSLTCEASGIPLPSITWLKDGWPLNLSSSLRILSGISNSYTLIIWLASYGHIAFPGGRTLRLMQTKIEDAGQYTCIVRNAAGEERKIFGLSIYDYYPPLRKCFVTGNPMPEITWQKDGQLLKEDNTHHLMSGGRFLQITNAQVSHTGRYTCLASNTAGDKSKSFSLNVLVSPTIAGVDSDGSPEDVSVILNSPTSLVCEAFSYPPAIITWFKNGTPLESNRNIRILPGRTLQILNAQEDNAGRYSCVATNEAGEMIKHYEVKVYIPPIINKGDLLGPGLSPKEVKIKVNNTLTLECEAYAVPSASLSWYKDGQPLKSDDHVTIAANGHTLQIKEAQISDTGRYTCVASNIAGEDELDFDVNIQVPPSFQKLWEIGNMLDTGRRGEAKDVIISNPISLYCETNAAPPPTLTWYKDGHPLTSSDRVLILPGGRVLQIPRARVEDAGRYVCVAVNEAGEDSLQYDVRVLLPPVIKGANTDVPEEVTVLVNKSALMECFSSGSPTPRNSWQKDGQPLLEDDVLAEYNSWAYMNKLEYVLLIISDFTFNIFAVIVPPSVLGPNPENLTVVVNNFISLTCEVSGFPPPDLSWLKNEQPIKLNTNALIVPGGRTLQIIRAKVSDGGEYTCIAINQAGESKKKISLTVYVPPSIKDHGSESLSVVTVREGTSVSLECESNAVPPPVVTWYKNGRRLTESTHLEILADGQMLHIRKAEVSDTGQYVCRAINVAGRDDKNFHLNVYEVIVETVSNPVTLTCDATGIPPPTISWLKNHKPIVHILSGGSKLQIARSQHSDSGNYTCIASNMEGKAQKTYILSIQGMVTADGSTLNIYGALPSDMGKYTCVATNPAGEEDRIFNLNVYVPPAIRGNKEEAETLTALVDTSVNIECRATGMPPPQINWLKNGLPLPLSSHIRLLSGGQVIRSVSDVAVYTCVASNRAGVDNKHYSLQVFVPPNLDNGMGIEEITVVKGSSTSMTCFTDGTPTPRMSWFRDGQPLGLGAHLSVSTQGMILQLIKAETEDSGRYTCVASNEAGEVSKHFLLKVLEPPHINGSEEPMELTVIVNNPLEFTCIASGIPAPKITWMKDGRPLPQMDQSLVYLFSPPVPPNIAGTDESQDFTVLRNRQVTLECKSDAVPPPVITWLKNGERFPHASLVVPPNIKSGPQSLVIHLNKSTVLECFAEGVPTPRITWRKDGAVLSGNHARYSILENGFLHIQSAHVTDSGRYLCMATNAAGTDRRRIDLQVHGKYTYYEKYASNTWKHVVSFLFVRFVLVPPSIADEPTDLLVTKHAPTVITCTASGVPFPTIQWTKNGVRLLPRGEGYRILSSVLPHGGLQISRAIREDAGTYMCVAQNPAGTALGKIKLNVQVPPIISPHPKEYIIAVDKPITLPCEADGLPPPDIMWHKDGHAVMESVRQRILSSGALQIAFAQPGDAGQYTCMAANVAGSSSTSTKLIVHVPPRIQSTEVHYTVNENSQAVLPCVADGIPTPSINWKKDNVLLANLLGKYTVEPYGELILENPEDSGTYTCIANNAAGEDTHTVTLTVHVLPTFTELPGDVSLNKGEQLRLNCKATGIPLPKLTWTFNNNIIPGYELVIERMSKEDSGTYVCTAENSVGFVKAIGFVHVKEPPVFKGDYPSNWIEPLGGNAVLNCEVKGDPAPTIQWSRKGMDIEISHRIRQLGNGSLAIYGTVNEDAGDYTCVATNEAGVVERSMSLTLQSPPAITLEPVETVINVGGKVVLNCQATGEPHPTITWSRQGHSIPWDERVRVLANNSLYIAAAQKEDTSEYECVARNLMGSVLIRVPRARGSVIGSINDVEFGIAFLNATVADSPNSDTRVIHAKITNVPRSLGPAMRKIVSILNPIYWTTAKEIGEAVNGFTLTNAVFKRETQVEFATGEILRMTHIARGLDSDGALLLDVVVSGYVLQLQSPAEVTDYTEDYIQIGPGQLYAYSTRLFTIDGISIPYTWNHTVFYDQAQGRMPFLVETLHASSVESDYNQLEETLVNFAFLCAVGDRSNQCPSGFALDSVGPFCADEDECAAGNPCSHTCHNAMGTYYCSCPKGLTIAADGRTCQDIDECALGGHTCHAGQDCDNTIGSYRCVVRCGIGFRRTTDGLSCQDIDECKDGTHQCRYNQICENTRGSYRCVCPRGYRSQGVGRPCIDINECEQVPKPCAYQCSNTPGSFKCICPPGQHLLGDGKSCAGLERLPNYGTQYSSYNLARFSPMRNNYQPQQHYRQYSHLYSSYSEYRNSRTSISRTRRTNIDECENRDTCQHECKNTFGSYQCICPPGYQLMLNGKTCQDVDECLEQNVRCGPNRMCFNMRGSYRCIDTPCPPDYQRHPFSGLCLKNCPPNDLECALSPYALEYKLVSLPFGIAANQDLIRLVAYTQDGVMHPRTTFLMLDEEHTVPFALRDENLKGVVYTTRPLREPETYRMRVRALSYSANGTIEYQTTFIVYIAVSAYPY